MATARPGADKQVVQLALTGVLPELLCCSLNGAEALTEPKLRPPRGLHATTSTETAKAVKLLAGGHGRGRHTSRSPGRRRADDPGARHELALALLELLGAPLGAWRSSNDGAAAADAADALPAELAAALGALGGGGPAPRGTEPGPKPPAAWLDPDGFFDALGDGESDAGAGGAGALQRAPPMHAWFQARLVAGRFAALAGLCGPARALLSSFLRLKRKRS